MPMKNLGGMKEHVTDTEFTFGLEDFYCGLPPLKCHNVATIVTCHSNMCPCLYGLQPN